jgi:tetratricopeptide (TPR) repeat protein
MNTEGYRQWYEMGQRMIEKRNLKEAIRLLTKAIELNPGFAPAYRDRGFCYQSARNHDQYREAILDLEKYLELEPDAKDKAQVLLYLGTDYVWINPTDESSASKAVDYLSQVIEINPQEQVAYQFRANARALAIRNWFSKQQGKGVRLKLTQFEEVISDYLKALELDPNDAYAYTSLNNLLNAAFGSDEDTIVCITNLMGRFPSNAGLYHFRGITYRGMGRSELALTDLDKAIALDPEYANAYDTRGSIYGISGLVVLTKK